MQKIFIGDVQGCAAELEILLERVRVTVGEEVETYFVGDLVNRGPENLRVLRIVRDLVEAGRGGVVLGNHDVALLHVAYGLRSLGPRDTFGDVLEAADAGDWIDWLRRLPVCITGEVERCSFALVHAALAAEWTLADVERRAAEIGERMADVAGARDFLALPADSDHSLRDDFDRMLRCRSVGPGGWSDAQPEERSDRAEPWYAAWSRRGHDYGVVYGHWSLAGLHVAPGLRGLDTGCVHHGRDSDGFLTAWVPGLHEGGRRGNVFAVPDEDFLRVRGLRRYVW